MMEGTGIRGGPTSREVLYVCCAVGFGTTVYQGW